MGTPLTKEYILDEVRKIQYLYQLSGVVRYHQTRTKETQSVPEHLYGMQLLAYYFQTHEPMVSGVHMERVIRMILAHDLDEIETGDVPGYLKTDSMRAAEAAAQLRVLNNAPKALASIFTDATNEYEAQESLEARFVKALDRFEPLIQMYRPFGRAVLRELNTTIAQSYDLKEPYLREFPIMYTYFKTIHTAMEEEGYFSVQKK